VERIVGVFRWPISKPSGPGSARHSGSSFPSACCPAGAGRIAAVEVLKSTVRTREYVEKGESEGKSLLDAMRDGSNEGMQHFDAELNKYVRQGLVDFDIAIGFATNAGNFRLEMQDYLEDPRSGYRKPNSPATDPDLEPCAAWSGRQSALH
jgi:hypothetical protein